MIAGTVTDTSTVTTKTTLDGAPFKLDTKPSAPLAQGAHVLRVQATDAAGNVTVKHARILVNTSERLGANALIAGAVGKDVKQLQHALVTDELLKKGGVTGFFDRHTIAAVKSFQVSRALPVTGQADLTTIGALTTRIVIDESSHSLTLIRPGQAPVVFGVAVGQSAYPTPTGSFHIISKVVDPTWTPPDSPWAQGELPVPPGPGQSAGHPLDGPQRHRRRHPRHQRPVVDRLQRLARLHPHADPRRRAAVHDGLRRHQRHDPGLTRAACDAWLY